MDGIPASIWRNFPHPRGPNLGGREHVPFTNFETILARQILSCAHDMRRLKNVDYRKHCRQDVSLALVVDDERVSEDWHPAVLAGGYERKDPVGTLGHKTLEMNDAFVELQVDDDDASTDSLESDVVHVQNPSFFSHRATVEDLISSFRKNTIGPLAGVTVRNDPAPDSSATPLITISDAVSQRSLDCALEKWRVEQEEKELEMRWRATKRVSENWLTKVQVVRDRQRARREKYEREREKRKLKAAGGAMAALVAKGPTMSQGNNRGPISIPQSYPAVPGPPQPPASTVRWPKLAPSQLPAAPPASYLVPSPTPSTSAPVFPQPNFLSLPLTATPAHANPSSRQTPPKEKSSPINTNFPHDPYDPHTPDLALEELAQYLLDTGQPNQISVPETATDPLVSAGPDNLTAEFMRMEEEIQCVQRYFDVAQLAQSPLVPQCESPSQDSMPPMSLSPSMGNKLALDESSGESSAPCLPQESHSHPLHHSLFDHDRFHSSANPTPIVQDPPDITPAQGTVSSEPTAEEKMMWHIWSLGQAPPGTAADVILRDPQASHQSNLAPVLFNMFPNFKGNIDESARVKILTGSSTVHEEQHHSAALHETQLVGRNAEPSWTLTDFRFPTSPLNRINWSPMLAPRAVIMNATSFSASQPRLPPHGSNVGMQTDPQDKSIPLVPQLGVSTSRPTPVLQTQDLPPPLPPPLSHVDSPLSPTSAHTATTPSFTEPSEPLSLPSALYPQYMPMGNRLYRIARLADADVLRPSYWFEPDALTTLLMQNVVNLMEESGGWRRPERRTRVFRGDRKAREPDDLASFDLCFGY